MKVLVVDANPASASAITFYLAKIGIDARAVESAADALAVLDASSVAMLIVDRLLPDVPVEHFLGAVRKRHADTPIVVTADALSEREYAELLRLGASECVLRSEIGGALITSVKSLLGETASQSAPPPEAARRESPRFAQVLPIGVRVATWEKFQVLYTSNISRGGVFVRSLSPAPIGTRVVMRFGLPDGGMVEIEGEVVHVRAAEGARPGKRKSGMGIRFVALTDEQQSVLAELAERAAKLGYGSEAIEIDDLSDSDDPFS